MSPILADLEYNTFYRKCDRGWILCRTRWALQLVEDMKLRREFYVIAGDSEAICAILESLDFDPDAVKTVLEDEFFWEIDYYPSWVTRLTRDERHREQFPEATAWRSH